MAKVKENAFVLAASIVVAALVAFAVTLFYPDSVTQADAPVLESFSITSTPASGGDTYHYGENVEITAVFDVAVSADPLRAGPVVYLDNGNSYHSLYNRGNGTDTLVYHYLVGIDHWDDSGLAVLESGIVVSHATIGGDTYKVWHPGLTGQTGHKVDGAINAPNPDH